MFAKEETLLNILYMTNFVTSSVSVIEVVAYVK